MSASAAPVHGEFNNDNLEPMFSAEQIQTRIAELGAEIARDYAGRNPLLLGVLKGAFIFLSDLMRAIDMRVGVEFMAISSYGASTRSSPVRVAAAVRLSLRAAACPQLNEARCETTPHRPLLRAARC